MIQPTIIPTLMPHGYNASIIEYDGNRLLTYRYHPVGGEWRTNLMACGCGDFWQQEFPITFPPPYDKMSQEDGRLFYFNGKLHLSFTLAVFPGVPNTIVPCVCGYGELVKSETEWRINNVIIPAVPQNDFNWQCKNLVFFEYNQKLHVIYQCSPEQIVYELDGLVAKETYKTTAPKWEHGDIRGGTQPLPHKGDWLRFFHSLHKHGSNRADWSYCIGALIQESKPPFTIKQISRYPIFSGDERYVPDCKHWKQGVAIAYGAIEHEDGWLVSGGLNDSLCFTMKVTESDLNL